jgi:hypothetical protein
MNAALQVEKKQAVLKLLKKHSFYVETLFPDVRESELPLWTIYSNHVTCLCTGMRARNDWGMKGSLPIQISAKRY